jgi:mercuric ion binding protein
MKSGLAKLLSMFTLALLLAGTALAADQTAKFKVTGMYCNACETKIHNALTKTDGVKSATVRLDAGSAAVTFDDSKVKPEQLIKIIEKEGYKAELQKRS